MGRRTPQAEPHTSTRGTGGDRAWSRGRRWSELYREQPQFVDGYLAGSCLAISRDAWNAVGAFDEEFFLYGEESEWQRRARSIGWSLVLVDELGVVHTGHGTVADDQVAALRSRDLLRANTALNLELGDGPQTGKSVPRRLLALQIGSKARSAKSARRAADQVARGQRSS